MCQTNITFRKPFVQKLHHSASIFSLTSFLSPSPAASVNWKSIPVGGLEGRSVVQERRAEPSELATVTLLPAGWPSEENSETRPGGAE